MRQKFVAIDFELVYNGNTVVSLRKLVGLGKAKPHPKISMIKIMAIKQQKGLL